MFGRRNERRGRGNRKAASNTELGRLLSGDNELQLMGVANVSKGNAVRVEVAKVEEQYKKSNLSLSKLFSKGASSSSNTVVGNTNAKSSLNVDKLLTTVTSSEPATAAAAAPALLKKGEGDDKWHEIRERTFTEAEQRDLRVIENREHLDAKRFYKSMGTGRKRGELPSRAQFGTVIAGAHEFYSARMTRRERRGRIIDEVLSDAQGVRAIKTRSKRYDLAKAINKRIIDPASRKKRKKRTPASADPFGALDF